MLGAALDAGFLSNIGTAMAMVFAAILSFVAFCFISIQMLAALVESYSIVVAAAFFFLGFGGSAGARLTSRNTSHWPWAWA